VIKLPIEVQDLRVSVDSKEILKGVSLRVERGEAVVLMGPNGSGKTTLAYALMGHPSYRVVGGRIVMDNTDITQAPTYERALMGLTLAFQNPVEVPGVKLDYLLNVINAKKVKGFDLTYVDPKFISWVRQEATKLGVSADLLGRDINVNFSGGERKRSEVLQVMALRPKYVIFDEPDSGLDVDGIRIIGGAIASITSEGVGALIITHHAEITKFINPTRAYVLMGGRVVASGGPELVEEVLSRGYEHLQVRGEQ
jgi:Fe-S cluster assembly ATP-binding protein